LVISSWVVLWRPVEIMIFGWIPLRQERRLVERLLAAKLSVRSGKPPAISATSATDATRYTMPDHPPSAASGHRSP
jgi:hypothetical protein